MAFRGRRDGKWRRRERAVCGRCKLTKAVASPSVRALASRRGIDLDELARRLGRETVAREDIENSGRMPPPDPAGHWEVDHSAYGPVAEEPVSRMAKAASRSLAAAQALVPAVTHHEEADIGALEDIRRRLKPDAEKRGVKLTTLAFHVAILTKCLHAFPRFNASLSADGNTLILKQYFHVGIAVDTPHGLIVPVIRHADRKGMLDIADEISQFASRARDRRVGPDEMGGASMTISNLGAIGGTAFSPIINPPEVAILGVSQVRTQPVWNGEDFLPARMVPLHLTYDHRVINGADAARFMAQYVGLLAEPRRLLL